MKNGIEILPGLNVAIVRFNGNFCETKKVNLSAGGKPRELIQMINRVNSNDESS